MEKLSLTFGEIRRIVIVVFYNNQKIRKRGIPYAENRKARQRGMADAGEPDGLIQAVIFFLMRSMAFFSSRDTCACEMPTRAETSIWVRPS